MNFFIINLNFFLNFELFFDETLQFPDWNLSQNFLSDDPVIVEDENGWEAKNLIFFVPLR